MNHNTKKKPFMIMTIAGMLVSALGCAPLRARQTDTLVWDFSMPKAQYYVISDYGSEWFVISASGKTAFGATGDGSSINDVRFGVSGSSGWNNVTGTTETASDGNRGALFLHTGSSGATDGSTGGSKVSGYYIVGTTFADSVSIPLTLTWEQSMASAKSTADFAAMSTQIMVRSGSTWYITDKTWGVETQGGTGGTMINATACTLDFTSATEGLEAVAWHEITFTAGTTTSISSSAVALDAEAGISGVGLLINNPERVNQNWVWIDNLALTYQAEAAVPEPATLSLLFGLLAAGYLVSRGGGGGGDK
jgi:hypothetical protein